ncbi:MAG: hypothetical protein IKW60_01705 [Clostridia bacterium]|nr:hypothetical protein [Clostridia bacterium]
MNPEIIVSLLSLAGTFIGSLAGILTANKLTNYRISQLEKRVNKHNNLIERTYGLEQKYAVLENRQRVSEHRLSDLEHERGHEG